jgi:hypothetical protein
MKKWLHDAGPEPSEGRILKASGESTGSVRLDYYPYSLES